ncbi:hypothetical protein B0H63DRAFT_118484 [Podospora didyma]|uniref:SET domain-containing protein n=1 Tax=Podospora didyma TaxID=330526 RepID=A0AAE0U4D6_9PEZI|nr:hypothetical protein B0H63DRAFT_118484 [Podospora didyma]
MTDKLPPLSTQIVPPSQTPLFLPTAVTVRDASRKQETVEEEPYTIKCICNFADDDGNTIYCEKCDTWQHIECYYPNNVEDALREDFAHSCVECEPRSLDRQQAIQRQKARTTVPVVEEEATDKKHKRPPAKSHKKKPKPTDLQLNGSGPHSLSETTKHHTSPHDHPHPHPHPHKKLKSSSHRSGPSISSQAPKRSPSYGNTKIGNGHPPSPATTPPDLPDDFEIHHYSSGFRSLCNRQPITITQTNSFASLQVSNAMSDWLRDPEKMQKETGCAYGDVFQTLPSDIETLRIQPEIGRTTRIVEGTTLEWQCLEAPSAIAKDVPLMELNGQIGFQANYCQDPENRWNELTSPLPFVLFHPDLPLYIDTRKEGSKARFVRRSCRPNTFLETYLSDGREYHFWLVSDARIAAKEQITIPWDFRFPKSSKARMLRILGLGDEETIADAETCHDEAEYQKLTTWVDLVLSDHGGCACNLGTECAFARFHRNYLSKTPSRPNPPKESNSLNPAVPSNPSKVKKRRVKAQHTISPTSTGHATNSRAASEGHLEDVPENDVRSVSGSSRSKPPSRDMTPTARQGSFDTLGILTEPTDRDKRKVTMIEDSFRRMEQQQVPPRKRKRLSDGTGSRTRTAKPSSETQTPTLSANEFSERLYIDVGTSRRESRSPTSAVSPRNMLSSNKPGSANGSLPSAFRSGSVAPQGNYRDAAVQTDPEERAWYKEASPTCTPKRRLVSLSKRLLDNRHRLRLVDEQEKQMKRLSLDREAPPAAMDIDSPTEQKTPLQSPGVDKPGATAGISIVNDTDDTIMPDATAAHLKPNGLPLMSSTLKNKSPDLRVQMPPVPAFGSPASGASTATTPLSAGGSVVQSPFSTTSFAFGSSLTNGNTANPSPVKKKLSLSDYTKSRMNKAAASRPSLGTTMLKPMSNSEDPKSATSVDNGGVLDSPTAEKLSEPTNSTASTTITSVNGTV